MATVPLPMCARLERVAPARMMARKPVDGRRAHTGKANAVRCHFHYVSLLGAPRPSGPLHRRGVGGDFSWDPPGRGTSRLRKLTGRKRRGPGWRRRPSVEGQAPVRERGLTDCAPRRAAGVRVVIGPRVRIELPATRVSPRIVDGSCTPVGRHRGEHGHLLQQARATKMALCHGAVGSSPRRRCSRRARPPAAVPERWRGSA